MDKRSQKELTRMGKKMGNGLGGMRMDRESRKNYKDWEEIGSTIGSIYIMDRRE
jgi:hypothetical protein